MADDLIVDTVETIVRGYQAVLDHTIVPAGRMGNIRHHLKVNVGSILFSTVLLLIAKAVAGFAANILDSFILNLGIASISVVILFLVPTIVMLLSKAEVIKLPASGGGDPPEPPTVELSNKVSSVAIFIWIWSLLFFIADRLLAVMTDGASFITWLGRVFDEPKTRIISVSIYTLVAIALLLFRSGRSAKLSGSDWILALLTVAILGVLNATMMYYLIFWLQSPQHPAAIAQF